MSPFQVWDILLQERKKGRSILLCTHFLDEADVLADNLVIMSRGVLKSEGSAVELKHKMGGGYRVFVKDTSHEPDQSFSKVPRYDDYDQAVYRLEGSAEVSRFIADVDARGIQYRVQGPTIEDVFLRLADELKDDFGGAVFAKGPSALERPDSGDESKLIDNSEREAPLALLAGTGTSWLKQMWILFCKRCVVLRSNYLPYLAAVVIPIITGGLTTRYLFGFGGLSCDPSVSASAETSYTTSAVAGLSIVYGPPARVPVAALTALLPSIDPSSFVSVNTLAEFNTYINNNYGNTTPGGFFLGENGSPPTFAYQGNYQISFAPLVQNLLDNVLAPSTSIAAAYQNFALPWAPGTGDTLQVILYFGLAMCAFPGFMSLYTTAERLRHVRVSIYTQLIYSIY
jgi:ATP-binding cassette subfamily A (ABC1) protein 3